MNDAIDPAIDARFPLITPAGQRRLAWLQEHPHAPRYNHLGVDRLDDAGLQQVAAFEAALNAPSPAWQPSQAPAWLEGHVEHCFRQVPFYRGYGPRPARFFDIPTSSRADLSRAPWRFVPDTQPLDGLIVYQTSGSTGHPLDILSHPVVSAHYLPLLRRALARHGVALDNCRDDTPAQPHIGLVLACWQASTYTYPAVLPYLKGAGFAKINLHPHDWRDPDDRARFLDACQPDVYSGDPLALAQLASLPLRSRPRALVSTALALLPGLRLELEARFGCPVIDVYSMNETGPIAAAEPGSQRLRLQQQQLYVEILDPDGAPCPPGTRGEVVLSGGFNPFLPLLRYRTGDWARLDFSDPRQPCLLDLEGRPPVVFRTAAGRPLNSIDVTNALKPLALAQYNLHQSAGGGLALRLFARHAGDVDETAIRAALLRIFGVGQPLSIDTDVAPAEGKVLQYTTSLQESSYP